MSMRPTKKIRQKLNDDKAIIIPGVEDPFAAKMVERIGFDGIYVGSYGTTARMIGQPDAGYVSQTEMVERVRYIADATPNLAIFADGEAGFGNPLNLRRTISLFEKAGAAGMQLNDTNQIDSRCPYIGLPDSIATSLNEMEARIKTALEARQDDDFLIYCSSAGGSLEERIDRCHAYLEAGADSVFFGWKEYSELEKFANALIPLKKPLKVSCYPFANKHPSVKDLVDMGYRIIFFVLHSLYVGANAEWLMLKELNETGNVTESLKNAMSHDKLLDLLGIDFVRKIGFQHEELMQKESKMSNS